MTTESKARGLFVFDNSVSGWTGRRYRTKVEKHIKNTYLKRVDAPVGVIPALRCWMELNE